MLNQLRHRCALAGKAEERYENTPIYWQTSDKSLVQLVLRNKESVSQITLPKDSHKTVADPGRGPKGPGPPPPLFLDQSHQNTKTVKGQKQNVWERAPTLPPGLDPPLQKVNKIK